MDKIDLARCISTLKQKLQHIKLYPVLICIHVPPAVSISLPSRVFPLRYFEDPVTISSLSSGPQPTQRWR